MACADVAHNLFHFDYWQNEIKRNANGVRNVHTTYSQPFKQTHTNTHFSTMPDTFTLFLVLNDKTIFTKAQDQRQTKQNTTRMQKRDGCKKINCLYTLLYIHNNIFTHKKQIEWYHNL